MSGTYETCIESVEVIKEDRTYGVYVNGEKIGTSRSLTKAWNVFKAWAHKASNGKVQIPRYGYIENNLRRDLGKLKTEIIEIELALDILSREEVESVSTLKRKIEDRKKILRRARFSKIQEFGRISLTLKEQEDELRRIS